MKRITFIISLFIVSIGLTAVASAQERKFCGQAEQLEKLRIENPKLYQKYLEKAEELERHTNSYITQKSDGRGTVYVIPIVFHIIHDYGIQNISNEQVNDAVRILNEDFRKLNADTSDIVTAFKAIAGDSEIEFRLAQKDPNGNCTNGIVRVASKETYKGETPSTSDVSRWPRANYLNVWVVNSISSGAAGYTNYPSVFHWSPNTDGIMILHSYIGSIGTGDLNRSRALTHEVGHWINLAHTWGSTNNPGISTNCSSDDNVSDTPNTIGWTSCNLSGSTCSSLDNVQNYMDYSYCSNMFSQGQSSRMRAALESTTAQRSNLWQPANLSLTGTAGGDDLCKADFNVIQTEVCSGETVNFNDASYNAPSSWNWSFPGGSPSVSTDKNPSVIYNTPGKYDVQLTVSNGLASVSQTKAGFINVLPSNGKVPSFIEGFETITFPNDDLFLYNPSDGITWEIANVGATGSKSLKINNISSTGALNEFSSTKLDLTSIPQVSVSFKIAFAQKNSINNDELKFFASRDCGNTWAMRWSKSGSNLATVPEQSTTFTPSDPTHWMEYTITSIPTSYLVDNFRFKFQFKGDGGNNIYIDDINIYDPATVGIEEQLKNGNNFNIYPNPFKSETAIVFSLNKSETVKITIIDVLGKETIIQQERNMSSGEHRIRLNGSDMNLSKGIYFIKLTQGDSVRIKKIILN